MVVKTFYLLLMIGLVANVSSIEAQEPVNKPLFDLESSSLAAEPGHYVLCPSRQFYDAAMEKGVDKTTFVYYAATLMEAGDNSSVVRNLAGTRFTLPNQMIIPIPAGQTAKVGDVLLTWWQSGSGMQRAIVVGGTATEPVVRYLDITLDNPSGAGKREDTLKPDSFYVLDRDWQPGSTVAVQTERTVRHGQLLCVSKSKVIVREFAGKLQMYDRDHATPIPVVPTVYEGDVVQAAIFGSFKPVTVKRVDPEIGRIYVNFQLGRKDQEKILPYGDVYKQ